MIITTHLEAFKRAQASELSGQALIKQAFALLLNMPVDRLIFRPGVITESQFTQGQYLQLIQAGRPLIQPLPIGENPAIPVVLRQEDIQPAFEALEKSLIPSQNNLHDRAVYLSAKELINSYKADPAQSIHELLSKLSYTTSRTGYTGLPFSPANALCAQLAWLVVDKSKRNPQEDFWKLLYPKATHSAWPQYGEAVLSPALAQGENGELLNYRKIFEAAQLHKEAQALRITSFYSGHFGFWASDKADTSHTEFKNYYAFFIALKEFTFANSKKRLGDKFEEKIQAEGDDEFLHRFADGLERFLAWHDSADLMTRRTIDSIICPPGKTSLINIVKNLLGKNEIFRCLNTNSENLKELFQNNSDIEGYLKNLPFNLILNEESLAGQDELDYLPSHCLFIENLDFAGLIHQVKHGKNIPIAAIASRFIALPAIRSKAEDLLNFLAYINDFDNELALINELTAKNYFPQMILTDTETFQHVLRIYDRHSMGEQRLALLTQIEYDLSHHERSVLERKKKEFMLSLIQGGHRDIETLKLLRKIERALSISIQMHHYLNSCKNYEPEIHAVLNYFEKIEKEDYTNLGDLLEFIERLSDSKQKLAFNYYRKQFIEMISGPNDWLISMGELPELREMLYDALKNKIKMQIKDKQILARVLKHLTHEQRVDFCEHFFESQKSQPLFESATDLNAFINEYLTYTENICLALKPFLIHYVKCYEDYVVIQNRFRADHLHDLNHVYKDSLLGWIENRPDIFDILEQQAEPKIIIDSLQDLIKSKLNTVDLLYKVFKSMTLSTFTLIFEKIDPSILEMINPEDYAKFVGIFHPEKSAFMREKLKPYYEYSVERAFEIYDLLNGFKAPSSMQNKDLIISSYRHCELMKKSWQLASIKDKEERILETYKAVIEERGLNPRPPENGTESPRLIGVKRCLNKN